MTKATDIKWETDNNDIDLPDEVDLPDYIIKEKYNVADYLSQTYGWLVKSYAIID